MADYRDLNVFHLSHELALEIHKLTLELPRRQRGELGDQLRRASMSVPANIVEGCGRDSDGDMLRHFRIALGSAAEVEYFLVFARDTGSIERGAVEPRLAKATSVRRMLAGLIRRTTPRPQGEKGNRRAAQGGRGASDSVAED